MTHLRIALALLFALSVPSVSQAAGAKDFGLGVVFGEPTGLTFKAWQSSSRAFDGGIAFSFNRFFMVYADYLFHTRASEFIKERSAFIQVLYPYAGIGAMASFSTGVLGSGSLGLGVRIPLGLEWKLQDPPLGFFLEVVPGIGIIPATYGFVSAGIGGRYYF